MLVQCPSPDLLAFWHAQGTATHLYDITVRAHLSIFRSHGIWTMKIYYFVQFTELYVTFSKSP